MTGREAKDQAEKYRAALRTTRDNISVYVNDLPADPAELRLLMRNSKVVEGVRTMLTAAVSTLTAFDAWIDSYVALVDKHEQALAQIDERYRAALEIREFAEKIGKDDA